MRRKEYREKERTKKEEEEKDPSDTPKFWLWHYRYHQKELDEINSITPIKVTKGDPSVPYLPPIGGGWLTHLW